MSDSDTDPHDLALAAFLNGVAFGRGTTDLKPITRRAATVRFERWWERNHDPD